MLNEKCMCWCFIETCRSSLSVFSVNNFRLIYDTQFVHLLVCNIQCCVCTLDILRFQQLHEVLWITKSFDFPNIGLQSLQRTPTRLELTVGLIGTFGLVVCEKHLNVVFCFDGEARFVSDHSKNSFVCVEGSFLYFFSWL